MNRAADGETDATFAWLGSSPMRAASDAGLGIVLLAASGIAYLAVAGMDLGRVSRPGPGLFPTVIAWTLLLVGIAEMLRAVLLREQEDRRWRVKGAAVIAVVTLCACLAAYWTGEDFRLRLQAPEWAALLVFVLSVMIALARKSRLRAAGVVLFGLLLGTVGVDVNSGVARLMFGQDTLADGLSLEAALLGFIIADAALCVASPPLLLTIYARKLDLGVPAVSPRARPLLRIAGGLVIAGIVLATDLLEDAAAIGQVASFAAFGLGCQFFGWNRLIFLTALLIGPLLEENIRRAALMSGDNPASLLSRPIGGAVVLAAVAVLTIAIALSAWRNIRGR